MKTYKNEYVTDNITTHILTAAGDSVTLCGYDSKTARLDLQTDVVSDKKQDTAAYNGHIMTMKRHRLLDFVC